MEETRRERVELYTASVKKVILCFCHYKYSTMVVRTGRKYLSYNLKTGHEYQLIL